MSRMANNPVTPTLKRLLQKCSNLFILLFCIESYKSQLKLQKRENSLWNSPRNLTKGYINKNSTPTVN